MIINLLTSILYYVFILLYISNSEIFESGIVGFFSAISDTISIILYYNAIHIVWVGLILFGLIKRNKELIFGGVFSIGLSALTFVLAILYFQI